MQLSSKLIKNVDSINSWQYTETWTVRRDGSVGEPATLHLQLIDLDRDGIRYIPALGAEMQVTIPSLDDAGVITKTATVAFADDRSIWKFDLLSTDLVEASNIRVTLTENGVTRRFGLTNVIRVDKINAGAC